jgi:hypothetical protein
MGGPSQQEQGLQNSAWSNLNSLFGTTSNAAQGYGASGNAALGGAQQFFQSLLSGNRTATANAVAPAATASTAAATAAKKQSADMGGGRTGGGVAQNQQIDDATRAQVDSLVGGAAAAAATNLENIGSTNIQAMLSALGIGSSSAGTLGSQVTGDINSQRQSAAEMWGSLIKGVGSVIGAAISKPSGA